MYIQVILNLNQEEKQLGNKFIVILKNLNSVFGLQLFKTSPDCRCDNWLVVINVGDQ